MFFFDGSETKHAHNIENIRTVEKKHKIISVFTVCILITNILSGNKILSEGQLA